MRKTKRTLLALACFGLALAGAGAYQLTNANVAQADDETVTPTFACAGASIRLDSNTQDGDTTGIRFRVKMDNATLETATANGGEVRILVMPTDLLGDGVLDVSDTDAKDEALTAWADFVEEDGVTKNSNYKQAYAYTYGMTEAEWNRPTTWRAYYLDSNDEPVYSDQMERSLSEVALSCEQDITETDTERKQKAGDYILSYTVTYDHSVRNESGEWKTTKTENVRFGTELSTLTDPTPEAREDFEFLAWEATKGADKIKTKDNKTIVTGNVTKEAYWLLTGSIDMTNVETMEQYADFTPSTYAGGDTISTVSDTTSGLTFQSKWADVTADSKFIYMDWKNICVSENIVCRMKGKQSTSMRASDSKYGTLNAWFQTGDTATRPFDGVSQKAFDNFAKFDATKFTAYDNYYVLGDFYATGNAVATKHTTSFEKFQIQAAEYYEDDEQHNASALDFLGGATYWKMDPGNSNSGGVAAYSDNKALVSDGYLAVTAGEKQNYEPLKLYYDNVSLAVNDKIVIKLHTKYSLFVGLNSDWGNDNFTFNNATAQDGFVAYVLTVNKAVTLADLQFRVSGTTSADFVIQSIEINPTTLTGETPLCLAGLNEGAKTVTFGCATWMTPKIEFGTDETNGDYVKYTFSGNTAWGVDALTFDFGGITLNAGDKVYLHTYTAEGARWPEIWVNGAKTSYYLTHSTEDKKDVFTATETTTLNTVVIRPQSYGNGYTFGITIYDLYIVRA